MNETTPGTWRSAVSEFQCDVCGKSTRYRHRSAECERCGKTYCRQKAAGKYCSGYCRNDQKNQTHAAGSRLRVERDEAREMAIAGWRDRAADLPADAPHWLRRAIRNGAQS